ncbi:unnamed protein product [Onchocerca ochengi]|uniref:SCP domain-containing protein n=1 Tax=Onchocerca ochengi TaxID=42157 RepID=A0A182EW75_ONCOC|nr:unnamed protein product [Onchocerca ochengi]
MQTNKISISINNISVFYKRPIDIFATRPDLAWGKTDKVGCGVAMHCDGGNALFVVCHFAPRGNTIGELIYERGIPCKANKHCRTKKCSRESGLCRT